MESSTSGHSLLGAVRAADRSSSRTRPIRERRWFARFARAGIGSRALIYALLAYFAVDIALRGHSPANVNASGAFSEVARQPAGTELLVVVAVGLLAYAAWRFVQAVAGQAGEKTSSWNRLGWLGSGGLYLVLCWQALKLAFGSGSSGSGGPSSHPAPFVGTALSWFAGPEIVGAVAVGLAAGGVALAIWSCVHDFSKVLDTRQLHGRGLAAARVLAAGGDVTRGGLLTAAAVYLMISAVTDDPHHVKSLDSILLTLAHHHYGSWLLGLVAVGLAAFSAYSVIEARYRRI